MSEMERNKGRLYPSTIDTSNWTESDWDNVYDNEDILVVNKKLYHVIYEVRRDWDCPEFYDVDVDDDGTIYFHTYHHNGGGSLSEAIEYGLRQVGEVK